MQAFNPGIQEVEEGGLEIHGQAAWPTHLSGKLGLYSKALFQKEKKNKVIFKNIGNWSPAWDIK